MMQCISTVTIRVAVINHRAVGALTGAENERLKTIMKLWLVNIWKEGYLVTDFI
ncbi:RPM1-interacting protein 4-like isoform X1 [Iris pallida]|uniref:RPM1-interacting protein 4-like isoform X1 n=1 Tax=Iris pallida TaxID=29817 RepID=A0AAX6DFP8_IRIPA|nr:RPM1-interacting protein 4-like isoform X1 [Iris pallida]